MDTITEADSAVDVVFVENDYNRAELSDMPWTLASSGTSVAGWTIVSTGPNTDSSGLSITLDEASGSRRTGNYSDSPFLGTMRDTKALGADIQRLSGSSFQGVFYTGPNGSSAASYVNGAVRPILGHMYCISGARSGLVCRNIVTSMNQSIGYPANLVCYTGQVYTNQESRVPAAGQGDSGGPAFATSSGASVGIYACGIISGIFGNSTVCTAEQDGKLCSFQVILAPVSSFFADNPGYGILASQPGS